MNGTGSRLSLAKKVAYAMGQGGNVLTYQLISTFVLTLYLPTAGKGSVLMPEVLWGVGTYVVLNVLARGIDTFFDPWIANQSDRSSHAFGRRRIFMAVSVLPLAACTGLIFAPPDDTSSTLNVVWLGALLTIYYCLFSTYVAPYLALLPELVPDKKENTVVSTMMAVAALVGGLFATILGPQLFLSDADVDRGPLRMMAFALAGLSFVMMLVPIIAINEPKLTGASSAAAGTAAGAKSHKGFVESLKATFSYRPFIAYVFGTNLFFFGFTIIQTGLPYYVEVLLQKPLSAVASVFIPLFGVAAASFPAIAWLANKVGKRKVMIAGAAGLAVLMGAGVPLLPAAPWMAVPLFALAGVPVACFLAVPNSMLADICDADAKRTGERREAMFFGAQGFQQKIALGIAAGLFQWIASVFGRSVESPLGVQLSGPLAALALVGSAFCFWRYAEKQVHADAGAPDTPSTGA